VQKFCRLDRFSANLLESGLIKNFVARSRSWSLGRDQQPAAVSVPTAAVSAVAAAYRHCPVGWEPDISNAGAMAPYYCNLPARFVVMKAM